MVTITTTLSIKVADPGYKCPLFMEKLLNGFGILDHEKPTTTDKIVSAILSSLDIRNTRDVLRLGVLFVSKVEFPKEMRGKFGYMYPLLCIHSFYVNAFALAAAKSAADGQEPDDMSTVSASIEIPTINQLLAAGAAKQAASKVKDEPEPRITMTELPGFPSNMEDWFPWQYQAECALMGAGAGRILTDAAYARQCPNASLKVKAMLLQAIAATNGYSLAQFVLPDDITQINCGHAIWHHILNIYQNGPIIAYHLEQSQKSIMDMECGDDLASYSTFVKKFLANKTQYTYLHKTATAKKVAVVSQYPQIDWNHRFKDIIRKSNMVQSILNACSSEETSTLTKTLTTVLFKLKDRSKSIKRKGRGADDDRQAKNPRLGAGADGKGNEANDNHSKTITQGQANHQYRAMLFKQLKEANASEKPIIQKLIDGLPKSKNGAKKRKAKKATGESTHVASRRTPHDSITNEDAITNDVSALQSQVETSDYGARLSDAHGLVTMNAALIEAFYGNE